MNLKSFIIDDLVKKGLTQSQAEEAFAFASPKVDQYFSSLSVDSRLQYDWENGLMESYRLLRYVFIGVFDGLILEWIDLYSPGINFKSAFQKSNDEENDITHYDLVAERMEIECIRAAKRGDDCLWVRNAELYDDQVKQKMIEKNYIVEVFFSPVSLEVVWLIKFS